MTETKETEIKPDIDKLVEERVQQKLAEEKKIRETEEQKILTEKLQKELEETKKRLNEKEEAVNSRLNTQRSIVQPKQEYSDDNWLNDFRKKLGELSFGELLALQGEFKTIESLPRETQNLLRRDKDDIIVNDKFA